MKTITVIITDKQYAYLKQVAGELDIYSIISVEEDREITEEEENSEVIKWALDAAIRIEHHYDVDVCYLAFYDGTQVCDSELGDGERWPEYNHDPEFPSNPSQWDTTSTK